MPREKCVPGQQACAAWRGAAWPRWAARPLAAVQTLPPMKGASRAMLAMHSMPNCAVDEECRASYAQHASSPRQQGWA